MSFTNNLLANAQVVGFSTPEKCLYRTYKSCDAIPFYHYSSNPSSKSSLSGSITFSELEKHIPQSQSQFIHTRRSHTFRALRHKIFSVSRRLFTLVFLANIIPLLIILSQPNQRRLEKFAIATSANITAQALIRQDHVLNLLFRISCSVPTSAPLWVRRWAAQVHQVGGVDMGLGITVICWLFAFTVLATMQGAVACVLVISYLNLILLLTILVLSQPRFRPMFKGRFEIWSRFGRWISLSLFWIKAGLFVASRAAPKTVAEAFVGSPSLWLMSITTLAVFSTWFEVRRIDVTVYQLSSQALRLDFVSSSPLGMAVPGTGVRVSRTLMGEYRTFSTIAQRGQEGFSVIVPGGGEWARESVRCPPASLYIRGLPTAGFMRVVPLFRSMLLVASGSGIVSLLPHLYAWEYALLHGLDTRFMPRMRIFWTIEDPENVFGKDVVDLILRVDPWAVIHDTRSMGRQDVLDVTWRLLRESGCEAVGVVGNKSLTSEVVYELDKEGIPVFEAVSNS